jgi:hypothetical protein
MKLPKRKPSKIDELTNHITLEMDIVGPYSDKYPVLLDNLERLTKLQREERSNRVSPDMLASVAGNLLGVLTIVSYEHAHVVTSKALGMLHRTKTPIQ